MDKHRRHSEAEFGGFDESEKGMGWGRKEGDGLLVRRGDKQSQRWKEEKEEEYMQIFD